MRVGWMDGGAEGGRREGWMKEQRSRDEREREGWGEGISRMERRERKEGGWRESEE